MKYGRKMVFTDPTAFRRPPNHYDVMAGMALASASLYTPLSRGIQNRARWLDNESGSFRTVFVKEVVIDFLQIDILETSQF